MRTIIRTAAATTAVAAIFATLWLASGDRAIAGSAVPDPQAPPPLTVLQQAAVECFAGDIHVSGDDATLILDMAVPLYDGSLDYSSGNIAYEDISCVLTELEAPTDVTARMDSTRALDGMQDAEWDGFKASWTYHPDDGLDLIITEAL